jgi:multidrug efflux pump subunit AcrB
MSFLARLLNQRRLILATSVLLALSGLASWVWMPRQEDPRLTKRFALVVAPFIGLDALSVERLILKPIEDELASVEQIRRVIATARNGLALISVELNGDVYDTDRAWRDIDRALKRAQRELPEGASEAILRRQVMDIDSIVLAITGPAKDLRELAGVAKDLKKRLRRVTGMARIDLIADPEEEIVIELRQATQERYGIDSRTIIGQLQSRNTIIPGGSLEVGSREVLIRVNTGFKSLDELRSTPIVLPNGQSVALKALAKIRHQLKQPVGVRMRYQGKPAVGLGLVAKADINLVSFGNDVRAELRKFSPRYQNIKIQELSFQPERVEARLTDLRGSLLLGIGIVAGILILFMGLRLGVVVSLIVPLVALSALAIYAWGGGVLHQISIAALVVALGMLVDNAIVMAENIQRLVDQGIKSSKAAYLSVRSLAFPLATATATTLAAFVPMLLAKGNTGDFTRSLPVVIMITLGVSYIFAVLVTPSLSSLFLRKRPARQKGSTAGIFDLVSSLPTKYPKTIGLAALFLVLVSAGLSPWVKQQFFPSSDRNQLVIDLRLPEGSHFNATEKIAKSFEELLRERKEVSAVASFIGQNAPRFYYNIIPDPQAPHLAQLVVSTKDKNQIPGLLSWLSKESRIRFPQVKVVPKKLEQGPPVGAPIEVRIYGDKIEKLHLLAENALRLLRESPSVVNPRHSISLGTPSLHIDVNDASASLRQVARTDVALAMLGRTRGLPVGQLRQGGSPIPIIIRGEALEGDTTNLSATQIYSSRKVTPALPHHAPLPQVATTRTKWAPAAIHRRNFRRVVVISTQLASGVTYDQVLKEIKPKFAQLKLGDEMELEYGGFPESALESNMAMMKSMPAGIFLLVFFLLVEFNSFRKLMIILATIPLAIAGVIPGLFFSQQPFGFMSLLGSMALVGIVVNNAIVLLDLIEIRRKEGLSLELALKQALQTRLRPILLTTATTIAGLLPLAFSASSLWPPLAWAMISGLAASTVLTLLVVPALYTLLYRRDALSPSAVMS